MDGVRTLLYDLEVSPMLAWAYGPSYETRLLKIEQYQKIMSISWRWLGDKKIQHMSLKNHEQIEIDTKIRDLLDEADIAVAHNGKRFDDRISRGAFLVAGLKPPSPFKNVDTKIMAKQIGMFPSNSLNDLCEMFGFGTKTKETYADLWYEAFVHHDNKSWNKMRIYNDQDVALLTVLYEKLLPYFNTHPNVANIAGKIDACPKCGGTRLHSRGVRKTNASTFRRYQCQDCGGRCTGTQAIKLKKVEFTNYS